MKVLYFKVRHCIFNVPRKAHAKMLKYLNVGKFAVDCSTWAAM